jgi:hypothetical protein
VTLTQALEYVQNRHNALNDSNWTPAEIYALMSARCNEVLSIIGLIEAVDTSITTVSGTQGYAFPTNVVAVKKVLYDGYPVKVISLRESESLKEGNVVASGRPEYVYEWNKTLYFIPKPDAAATVTLYVEKLHPFIDGSTQTTIDIPAVLHYRMLDGVLSDMYAKDLNQGMCTHYETLWNQKHMPAFWQYKNMMKYRGQAPTVMDVDTNVMSGKGIV